MNNLRKTAVMLFIGVFITSMLFVPITPYASVDSQVAAPTDYEQDFVEKWAERILDEPVLEKIDPVITSYIETGVLDDRVDTTRDGATKLLVYLPPTFEDSALDGVADVMWKIDLKLVKVASIAVDSMAAMKQLVAMDDIQYIQADYFLEPEPNVNLAEEFQPDMFAIRDLVGATGPTASGFDGTGVIAGVVDSGVDFSQEDMRNAEYNNGTYPMSYDPSSRGMTEMYIANNTVVANTTAWLEAGNLLTYMSGGNYYLNVTGWDPVCNNEGGHRNLLGLLPPYGDGYPYGAVIGFIGLYEWAWGGNNVSEFVYNEMWKDWEIPAPTAENYTFGWAFQQKIDGYAKVFAPSMIYDGDLIIDWNGTLAWTSMWNWAIRSQVSSWYAPWEIDLNTTADRDLITGMMDWSFTDDIAENYIFNKDNNVLMADVDDDATIDVTLGSLSWAYDGDGYLAHDYGLFFGMTDDHMVWNAMFTTDSDHGHWTAATIASAGTYGHDVYGNGTLYNLPGIAPGAKIIASKGITSAGDLAAQVWCMGFTLNETSGYWEYIGDGPSHRAHMVSNSWGWGPGGMYLQLRIYSMVYDLASIPDVLATGYPGVLMFFSAGNEGSDYGSMGTPGGTYSVVSVGATMANHLYVDSYGPYQPHTQQAFFTATGPAYAGFVKPDVMAPGFFGYNPTPSENDWFSAGPTYTWWSGTSLSCPIAAGVAALIMDAGNNFDPQRTKNILLSTATDMGYDPLVQGHGFVNAEAACAAVSTSATGEYIFETESFENYGEQIADSWAYWVADWAPFGDIYYGHEPELLTPGGLESSSLFFGTVDRGEVKEVTMHIEDFAGTGATVAGFDDVQPWYYTELDKFTYSYTGYTYNDTLNNQTTDGFFNLYTNMTVGQQSNFDTATYATIQIAFDAADTGISARLYDWIDDYGGTELNWWNGTHGDTLIYVHRCGGPNLLTMRVASTSTLGTLFTGVPTLVLFGADGVTVDVTIQVWQKSTTTEVALTDFAAGVVNATLTVPADAEYGVHQGSITFTDGAWTHEIPYSYTVEMDLTGAEGDVMTLVDGATDPETTPYDTNTAITYFTPDTDSTQDGGGFTTFHIDIPYDITLNASVLVMRAKWQNLGTVVDFTLRTETGAPIIATDDGGRPFDPNPTEPLVNTIVWDPGYLINDTYWFEYNIHVFDGASVPEDIVIEFQLYGPDALADAVDSFTWTANDHPVATAISGGQILTGDHILLNSTWDIAPVPGLPEYSSIAASRVSFLSGLYAELTGIYADPQGTDAWPVPLSSTDIYVWETVDGVAIDDITTVTLDAAHGADPSFDVYMWDDLNADGLVDYETELASGVLLSVDNGGSGAVETGVFTAPASGSIAIRVFCWAWAYPGAGSDYTLTVDSRVSIDIENEVADTAYTTYDTYQFERNVNFTVFLYVWTDTDVAWTLEVGMLRFENFYTPTITVNDAIDLGDDTYNFTWTADDGNAADTLYFSVWVSADGGDTFQLVIQNITETFYVWDSTGWLIEDYIYMVRVYDNDHTYPAGVDGAIAPPLSYWPGLFADDMSGTFEAGTVIYTPPTTPTTTTTPEPTTSPTSPPVGGIDPLLIGLLGGIGVGVVILLILFLIRKR
jgi:hypothetical protein